MSTTAHLTYAIPPPDGSRAYTRMDFDPDTASDQLRNWTEDIRKVAIEDVRGKEDEYTLDSTGFQFYRRPARHTRFLDEEEIRAEYYPESIELIKELTGATKVFLFDHTVRRRRPGVIDDGPQNRQPIPIIHVDQTAKSSIARLHSHLPDDAGVLLRSRFQIINLWRPISHPAVDWPLAFCDHRSLDVDEDLIEVTLIFGAREGQNFSVKYSPDHRWVYKSAMDPEDFVLFKCFDSVLDGGVATMAAHTAFEDPNTPEDAPFRESIELRAFVFYEES